MVRIFNFRILTFSPVSVIITVQLVTFHHTDLVFVCDETLSYPQRPEPKMKVIRTSFLFYETFQSNNNGIHLV